MHGENGEMQLKHASYDTLSRTLQMPPANQERPAAPANSHTGQIYGAYECCVQVPELSDRGLFVFGGSTNRNRCVRRGNSLLPDRADRVA